MGASTDEEEGQADLGAPLFGSPSGPDSGASTDEQEGSLIGPLIPDIGGAAEDFPSFDEIRGVPAVLTDLGGNAKALLRNPVNFILVTVLAAILGILEAILNGIGKVFDQVAAIPRMALFDPFVAIFQPYFEWGFALLAWLEQYIMDVSTSFGIAAPFVTVILWAFSVFVVAVIVNAILGLVGTYLPLNSIPVLRRVV